MSLAVGLDIGTSGVRAAACREDGEPVAIEATPLPPPVAAADGRIEQDAELWWQAAERTLHALFARIDRAAVRAIAVDGTSGTVLAVDAAGRPLGPARLYNDQGARAEAARIAAVAPPTSGAHGATSGLAKAMALARALRPHRLLHQADFVAGRLCGRFDVSDENNALKTGYDPVARRWPDFIDALGLDRALLPEVVEPGQPIGELRADLSAAFGLPPGVVVVAGTTDGCASFLAAGATEVGDAVTALGSTLTLKILADAPVFDPSAGVYSHRLLGRWLAGGASNSGGAVLAAYFSAERLRELEPSLDPTRESGLDYYPLLRAGERFPVADPALPPRLEPRPADDALFLQGLLEGIARIEARGYRRLAELGAPLPRRVMSVGKGARNRAFETLRRRLLATEILAARAEEAAIGVAHLAREAFAR